MNKSELVEEMARLTKLPKSTCKECLEGFVTAIGKALRHNNPVAVAGFGTFLVMKRKSRSGINPATKKKMTIPAKKVAKFKPGKALKETISK